MKLIFFPVLFWSLLMPSRISSEAPALCPALLAGGLLGTLLVPVLFYTYSGILGYDVTWVDIGIFFISILAAFACAWILRSSEKNRAKKNGRLFSDRPFYHSLFSVHFPAAGYRTVRRAVAEGGLCAGRYFPP